MTTAENYKKGIQITEIDTPSIIVDLNIAEENIKKMQSFANDNSVSMRPHSKTNKSPYWAKKQIEAGAIGICCAKLGEAEMMAAGGVKEILIPNQIVTPEKIKRLVEVNKKSKVMIAVENYDNVSKLSEEFEKNSMKLGVIIEVNVGMDRCGVELDEIVDFAKNINDKQGLDFEGIMGYEGHTVNIGNFEDRVNETTKAMNKLIKAKDILEENNMENFLKIYELFVKHQDNEIFENINTKTLIMTGENDIGSTPEMSKNLSKKIANSKVKIVSNGKHLCSIECADDVNNAIKEHIKND